MWVIDTAYAVVPQSDVDATWLYYALSNHNLSALNEATGVPSISRDYLYRVELDKPGLDEQRKIAHILTTVNDLIDRTEALIAKLRAIKQGVVHDLLTHGVEQHGQLRPRREEDAKVVQGVGGGVGAEKVGILPKCEMSVPQAEYGISSSLAEQGKLPVVRMNNLSAGAFVLGDLKYTSQPDTGVSPS